MKMRDAETKIRDAAFGASLSRTPVRFLVDVDMPNSEPAKPGEVRWVDQGNLTVIVQRRMGVALAPVSVLRHCRTPDGTLLHQDSNIATIPVAHAEALEAAGHVKILHSDRMIEIHKAAWAASVAAQSRAIARSREMSREAVAFAREAGSEARWRPVIDWDAPPVATGEQAAPAPEAVAS